MTNAQYQRKRIKRGPCLLATLHRAITKHCREQGIEPEFALRDAVTDLRHLADIYQLDFAEVDANAYECYLEETAGVLAGEVS